MKSGDGSVRLDDVLAGAVVFALPLTTSFRGIRVREGVLLHGPSGWGEFTPFPEYDNRTAARWLAAAVESAFGQWPAPVRDHVPVNAIVPAVPPSRAAAMALSALEVDGCATVKVKVAQAGQSVADDVNRVAAVRSALVGAGAAEPKIRIDANGAWSVGQAVTAIRMIDHAAGGLEYVEQPCRTLPELAVVRSRISVPVAADESIRTADDPLAAARAGAADIVVIKVPPLGGVAAAMRVARDCGVDVVVSGAMDSSIGLAAGVAAAAALNRLPYACGLGTGALLADDLVAKPTVPRGGALPVTRPDVDQDALTRAAARVSAERRKWWLDRLRRAWEFG